MAGSRSVDWSAPVSSDLMTLADKLATFCDSVWVCEETDIFVNQGNFCFVRLR